MAADSAANWKGPIPLPPVKESPEQTSVTKTDRQDRKQKNPERIYKKKVPQMNPQLTTHRPI